MLFQRFEKNLLGHLLLHRRIKMPLLDGRVDRERIGDPLEHVPSRAAGPRLAHLLEQRLDLAVLMVEQQDRVHGPPPRQVYTLKLGTRRASGQPWTTGRVLTSRNVMRFQGVPLRAPFENSIPSTSSRPMLRSMAGAASSVGQFVTTSFPVWLAEKPYCSRMVAAARAAFVVAKEIRIVCLGNRFMVWFLPRQIGCSRREECVRRRSRCRWADRRRGVK